MTQQLPADSTTSPAAAATGLRVLVVEDEALIRLDLGEMLTEEGYQVAGEAADGEQAVAQARELRPDLVIMDVKMPKMDGIEAAATIVEERIAPVVMLTAFSQRELIEQARDAGALAYLVKPFARHELVPAISWPCPVSREARVRTRSPRSRRLRRASSSTRQGADVPARRDRARPSAVSSAPRWTAGRP